MHIIAVKGGPYAGDPMPHGTMLVCCRSGPGNRELRDANVVDVMTACTLAAAVRGRKQGAVRGANAVPRVTTPADGVTTHSVAAVLCTRLRGLYKEKGCGRQLVISLK